MISFSPQFYNGDWFEAYRFFGAHPLEDGKKGWIFRIWAPNAQQIQIVGDFNNWEGQEMISCPFGYWEAEIQNAQEGQLYKFYIRSISGEWSMRSDPYAFESELRPGSASKLSRLNFIFQDSQWMDERGKRYNQPLNIYELHMGSWKRPTDEFKEGTGDWYNYEELADMLIPWLKEHRYTHVELLPLSEHPFDGSWGYQVTGYFAPTSRYGTPKQFAEFVNRCHIAGIGVLMDVVPVHFSDNADALRRLDGTALYEYDSDVGFSEWGTMNFNYYRGEVSSFLCSAAAVWMDLYHCDGIRVDAVSRAIYWLGDPGRGVNPGAVNYLKTLNHGLNERWPTGIYIAEDSTNYPKVTAPTRYGGLGFDYKWNLGWMHDALDYFSTPFDQRVLKYEQLRFSMHYFFDELFILSLSHDEVVHGKKSILDKMWGNYEEKFSQARLFYLYMYAHPGKKLNFMGNEIAQWREWSEQRPMDWELLTFPIHDAFQRYVGAVGKIYTELPALYDGDYHPEKFRWINMRGPSNGVYAWIRQSVNQSILFIGNTMPTPVEEYRVDFGEQIQAELLIDSAAEEWGGTSTSRYSIVKKREEQGAGCKLCTRISPLSGLLFLLHSEGKSLIDIDILGCLAENIIKDDA